MSSYPGTELELFRDATNWKAYFARFVKPFVRGAVLEVGAGAGATTAALSGASHERWLCLEPDSTLAAEIAGMCEIMIGTTADLDPRPQFDTILYIDVLEHIDDDRAELERASRLLRDDGHLVVLVPARQSLYSAFDAAIGHHRRYDRETLDAAMPPLMPRVSSRYLDSLGVLVSLANRIVLRSSMPTPRQIAVWDKLVIPLSRVVDPLLGYRAGKSLLEVRRKARA